MKWYKHDFDIARGNRTILIAKYDNSDYWFDYWAFTWTGAQLEIFREIGKLFNSKTVEVKPLYDNDGKLNESEENVITIITFITPFITLTLEESMFRFLIDAKNKREEQSIITQTVLTVLTMLTIACVLTFIIIKVFSIEVTNLFIPYIIAVVLMALMNALVRGLGKIKQYAIEIEDAVTKVALKDAGVKKVKWIAEQDHKTCGVCNELDGQIFKLKDAPPKQHYHCRCYLIPIK